MGFLVVLFFVGLPGYGFLANGKVVPGLVCVGIVVIAFILHLGWLRDLRAWNNQQNYWAYGETDWMHVERKVRKVRFRRCAVKVAEVPEEVIRIGCPKCGSRMHTVNRHFKVEDGREVSIYRCPECLKRLILEI